MTGKSDLESVVRLEGAACASAGPLDLAVGKGELIALVGPRACGKSDVLRMAAGLLPTDTGSIRVSEPDPGFVWEDPLLLPWRTVRNNVLLGAEMRGLQPSACRERAHYLLGLLGAADHEEAMPIDVSPAIARRAAVARALVHAPALVLFDNPFGGLDPLDREQLWLDLQRLWMIERFAAIVATTDITEAIQLGDRVVVLSERPARVLETMAVDLPRPRRMHKTMTTKIADYGDAIRTLLRTQGALP